MSSASLKIMCGCLFFALLLCGCEKKEPEFVPAEAKGRETAVIYDQQKDQPKFLKIKKKDGASKDAVRRRRELKEKLKAQYRNNDPWEY